MEITKAHLKFLIANIGLKALEEISDDLMSVEPTSGDKAKILWELRKLVEEQMGYCHQ